MAMTISWVQGHADDPTILEAYSVSLYDLLGNSCADKMANAAADLHKVFEFDAFNVKWHYALIQKVQAKALCIFQHVLEPRISLVPHGPKLPKQVALGKSASAFKSEHSMVTIQGKTLYCTKRLETSPTGAARIMQ